ncbi:probable auxin efflux carrier component 5b isoform X2 [Lolium rigidum]|uniref:probable auxin efflux carrier component 5b isoform X2 n=1 Tax=Lolium rigidum TaxID=89674 RepID=UPI001F5DA7B3|nr:probable auxin efflux carrier component 5b isoform X2 [Lolium rigidum]
MIGWGDVYKVVGGMAPLYFALGLGYCSVRRWKLYTRDQCDALNHLATYFAVPFFAFDLAVRMDPYALNYRVLAADALSKLVIVLALAAWAIIAWTTRCGGAGGSGRDREFVSSWCITGYSLTALNNSLVVGVPLMEGMFGEWGRNPIVQISVPQFVFYFPLLLLAFEVRRASGGAWKNPSVYAGVLGVAWSCVTHRWHIETPSIIEGSVLIISRTGLGLRMFSIGQFMALQERIIACGTSLTALGMVLRFIAGPAATAAAAAALGLRGDVLRATIIQAALPQSITAFGYARVYGLHADVLSTGVIFGTLVSLPVLILYNIALGFV